MLVTLTVAGSDSLGGAGIEADIKAMSSLGAHPAVSITAVTSQNSQKVSGIFPIPASVVISQLDAILEAGRLAPTAKNLQEQRVYVVQSENGLAKIDKITPCRYGAATVIAVAFNRDNVFTYPGEKRDSGIEDATIVATHMVLAAKAAGVDSCWINFFDPEIAAKELNLPENEEVLMLLDLGYPVEGTKPLATHNQRKEISETVTYM